MLKTVYLIFYPVSFLGFGFGSTFDFLEQTGASFYMCWFHVRKTMIFSQNGRSRSDADGIFRDSRPSKSWEVFVIIVVVRGQYYSFF